MAALSIHHSFQAKKSYIPKYSLAASRSTPTFLISCQSQEPVEPSYTPKVKTKLTTAKAKMVGLDTEVDKIGKHLRESLSPKQKGDWIDVLLMSFSFAVYVYISQKLVCAYCAWLSMFNKF